MQNKNLSFAGDGKYVPVFCRSVGLHRSLHDLWPVKQVCLNLIFGFWSCWFSTCVCFSIAGCSWWFPCLCHSGGETSCFTSSSASPSGSDSTSHSSLPSRQKRWVVTHFATKDETLHKDMNINQNLKYRWSVTIHRHQHLVKVALTLGSQIFRWPQKSAHTSEFPFYRMSNISGCPILLSGWFSSTFCPKLGSLWWT